MASVLRMPGVSADMTEAALLEWSVAVGSSFRRGEPIALIETDKASVELEAEEDAVLLRTLAEPGQTVPVGDPIAVLVQPGEQARDEAAIFAELGLGAGGAGAAVTAQPVQQTAASPEHGAGATTAAGDAAANGHAPLNGGRVFASPLARRLAAAAGLKVETIAGTGPGGRVTRRDVEAASAAAPAPAPVVTPPQVAPSAPPVAAPVVAPVVVPAPAAGTPYTDVPHSKMRKAIAGALTASKQQVPHFYLRATCRVDALLELRAQVNGASTGAAATKVSVNDFVLKAAARALVDVPEMNVIWTPDAVRRFGTADVAVAVSTERGLVTPVVRGVERRSISDVSAAVKDFAARAAAGTLKQTDLEGGSLTISNLGMYGVEEFSAIINPPQAGILAVGAAVESPVKGDDGGVTWGRTMTVVLSVDHRPVDGVDAARWLDRFKTLVENPLLLLV